MTYEIKVFDCLCATERFTVNGKAADRADFGSQADEDEENAEPYGCGNMQFRPKLATSEVLAKYGITVDEYNAIATELAERLSFGCCGWCI